MLHVRGALQDEPGVVPLSDDGLEWNFIPVDIRGTERSLVGRLVDDRQTHTPVGRIATER